jgi:Reverse transcriptase (RNA-dependent DNA polymerase)
VEIIDTPSSPTPFSANAAAGSSKPADLVAFAHAALWSPALSTLEKALEKKYISNIPGLTQQLLRKYPPNSRATAKGHLDQLRQGTKSTKSKSPPVEDFEFPFELAANNETRSHECFAALIPPTGLIYTDQTGRFVCPSETGNNYLMVLYDYDSNAILAEAIPNRTKKSLLAAFTKLHAQLCAVGLRPKYQRLDNECSDIMKEFMTEQGIKHQFVPPNKHRRNAAERAIRTLKNHLIAGFCSLDENFPLSCWDKTLPHGLMAINLLRGSRINPNLSAYAQIHGAFDFNATPMAPPGIRVLIHEKPNQRKTWMPHAVDGWYLGPAMEHYHCHRVWCWATKAERVCDTISWFPTKVQIPTASSADTIQACLEQIVVCLRNPAAGSPLAPLTNTHVEALQTIQRLIVDPPTDTTERNKPDIVVETVDEADAQADDEADITTTTIAPSLETAAPPRVIAATPTTNIPTPTATTTTAPSPRVTAQTEPATAHDDDTVRRSNRTRRLPKKFSEVVAAATAAVANAQSVPVPKHRRTAKHKHHSAMHRANCAIIEEAIAREITEHMALLGNAINPDTGASAEYNELVNSSAAPLWIAGNTKEIRRLLATKTIRFISIKDIPKGIKPTYLRIVCAYRPEKEDPYRVRWTIGGDRIIFHGEVSTKAADITTVKAHLNSVVSTPNAKFCGTDVKDFYLNTPMDPKDFAYMRIPIKVIPKEIMDEYNLWDLVHNDAVYVEVMKGMYGLKQAGRIANDQLTEFLAADGYAPVPITPGLWRHATRDITFTLVVDDFGIKYTNQDDLDHLLASLRKHYTISVDLTGSKYLGLDIELNLKIHFFLPQLTLRSVRLGRVVELLVVCCCSFHSEHVTGRFPLVVRAYCQPMCS